MKALVVNKIGTERTVLTAQLAQLGLESEIATTADGAFDMLQGGTFAVVFLSYGLAGANDGLGLLRRIRAQASWAELPVVLLTSADDVAHIEEAYDAAVSEFLVQPADADALLEKLLVLGLDPEPVRTQLPVSRRRRVHDPAAASTTPPPEDPEARRAA